MRRLTLCCWLMLFMLFGLLWFYGIYVMWALYFVVLCIDYKLYEIGSYLCGEVARLVRDLKADEECPVCLAILAWSTQSLACGHRFHQKCIHRWLRDKKTCPCCRAAVL